MSNVVLISLLVAIAAVIVNCENGELQVEILQKIEKCDRKTKKHDLVTMHYTGFLENGTKFDSR